MALRRVEVKKSTVKWWPWSVVLKGTKKIIALTLSKESAERLAANYERDGYLEYD